MRKAIWIGLGTALASGLAAAGAAGGRYQREMRAIAAALEAGSLSAGTPMGRIEYGRAGGGRPVLAIHGAGGGFDQGLLFGKEAFSAGFDIVAPSRFGYLGTPVLGDGSPAAQADAHAALLDRLGVASAVVAGISAGAPSAIEFALRHPARTEALVLLVPRAYAPDAASAHAPPGSARMLAAVEGGQDFAYWCALRLARRAIVRFLGVPPALEASAPPAERARVTELMRSLLPLSRRVPGLVNDAKAVIGPWPLERIAAPTFIVSAADDLYGTLPAARFTAMQIRGAELLELPSGGHLMVGRIAEVRARLASFLARTARPAKAA